ncbi:MAG: head decoration protein [Candidatus Omnitrophica bacterium]|nr:head decoration protein [Candidatus Omnitrophota bacterium]
MALESNVQSEGVYPADVVKWEADQRYTREKITLKGTEDDELEVGQILEEDEYGDYVTLATAANAAAILLENVTIPAAAEIETIALIRGPAIVTDEHLAYNEEDSATVNAALLNLGIKVESALTWVEQTT